MILAGTDNFDGSLESLDSFSNDEPEQIRGPAQLAKRQLLVFTHLHKNARAHTHTVARLSFVSNDYILDTQPGHINANESHTHPYAHNITYIYTYVHTAYIHTYMHAYTHTG